MKLERLTATLALAALSAGVTAPAYSGIIFFTDRPTWEAAVGAASFTEDFSGFASDTQFRTASVALSGMSIAQEGTNVGDFRNYVDVAPFEFTDNNGSSHASMFTDFEETLVRIAFNSANGAFGGESWGAASGEVARMEVYDGTTLLGSQDLTNGSGDFLGYQLTGGDTATSVLFSSVNDDGGTGGEGFGLDNLAGVNAAAAPAPGSLALLGLALVGLGALRRRGR